MKKISQHDIAILRKRAQLQLDYANSPQNEVILKQWEAQAEGRRESPPVRLLFSNFFDEVITPRLECEGDLARSIEARLLSTLAGRELFNDDTPIAPTYNIQWETHIKPFGLRAQKHRPKGSKSGGYHIEPVITDLEEEIDQLKGGYFGVNRESTLERKELLENIFGDILPTQLVMGSLPGGLTNPIVHLMGMEEYYLAMYDCPEAVHQAMDMGTRVYEAYYDFLEKESLLLPTHGISPVGQETFAFNNELPANNVTKTKHCWGFLESQETTAVSSETFGEFVRPYQQRLADRFGLLSYGCCERVDDIWEDHLSQWSNLRKLSVSPFNNEDRVGEYLRGTRVVYYSKPRAEYVTCERPMDEEALTQYFKGVCEAASGCLFEIAQREVGTIFGEVERGRRYVELAKQAVDSFWSP